MKLTVALAALAAVATCAAAEPANAARDRSVRAVIAERPPPAAFGARKKLSDALNAPKGWAPFTTCLDDELHQHHFHIPQAFQPARDRGLIIDVALPAPLPEADGEAAPAEVPPETYEPKAHVWCDHPSEGAHWVPADDDVSPDAVERADDARHRAIVCPAQMYPGECAALVASGKPPVVRTHYVPPGAKAFALVPSDAAQGGCVSGFIRVRTPAGFCARGSKNGYVVPRAWWYNKGKRRFAKVPVRKFNTAMLAQAACDKVGADFAGITAENLAEVSKLAHKCVRAGGRLYASSWNTDSYDGLGVQMIASANPDKNAHVGQPELTGRYPILCKRRAPGAPRRTPVQPVIKVLPAPEGGWTRSDAEAACNSADAKWGRLADLAAGDGTWDSAVTKTIARLGSPARAWVRSWNADAYDNACVALAVDARERVADTPGSGGAIVADECEEKLHGAVCVEGAGEPEHEFNAATDDELDHDDEVKHEHDEVVAAENAEGYARRSEL